MFGIAYRTALTSLRRLDEAVDDADADEDAVAAAPDHAVSTERVRHALAGAIDTLPVEQRAVVTLTYYQHLGYREIAEILECPVDTVKTRMFHARRKLRQALPGDAGDWL